MVKLYTHSFHKNESVKQNNRQLRAGNFSPITARLLVGNVHIGWASSTLSSNGDNQNKLNNTNLTFGKINLHNSARR